MDAIFYYLLNMGITAVLIGLPVCLLRLFRQVPRFLVHLAWAFVGIRLMIPFTFSSNLSLLSLGGHLVKRLVPLPGNAGSPSGLSFSNVFGLFHQRILLPDGLAAEVFPRAAFAGTGGGKVKHRVTAVLERMSHPWPIALLLVLFFAILGVSLLSNPRMPPKPSTSGLPVVEVMNALSSQFHPPYIPSAGISEAQAKTLCLDWLKMSGYAELCEDMLQISNMTREEGWNNEKIQIFSVSGYGWDYGTAIIRDGKVLNILSGMAMLSLWLADLDADGLYECYGNAAFGSGIVNMEVLGYNPAARKAYKLSNRMVEDYNLSVRDGVLVVDVIPYGSAGSGSSKDRVTMRLALNGGKMVLLPMEAQ